MPRRGENIYKRKDGRWEGRYIKERTLDNKAKYGYVYGKTYREAKYKLSQAKGISEGTVLSQGNPDSSRILFMTMANEWLEITRPKLKESTNIKYYNLLYSYILPALGECTIDQITNEKIEAFCNELLVYGGEKNVGLSTKTVSDTLALLRNIFKYSSQKGIAIPCNAYSIQIKQTKKEMRVFSQLEQEKLCQYLNSNLNACNVGILVCLFTGIRIGEVCALQWEDISITDHTIYVHQTMQRIQSKDDTNTKTKIIVTTPKSICSIRTIPLPDDLVKVITEFSAIRTGYFLTGSFNKFIEPRTMQNHFKKVLKETSISAAAFHTLRHTFATRCIELGFDVKTLSEILGHASVNITMNRYVHPSMELKRENMQRLSLLMSVK